MSSHTNSVFGRLEIVERGRRRRWSEEEKARIVLESLAGPRLVSATARRHGVSRAQLLVWRRSLKVEREEVAVATPRFVPAIVEPEPVAPPRSRTRPSASAGRIEIMLSRGRRVIVDTGVDAAALSRIHPRVITESLPTDLAAAHAMILVERAARMAAEADLTGTEALIAHLKLAIEKLRRGLYGHRSERTAKLLDQMELELESWRRAPPRTRPRRRRRRTRRPCRSPRHGDVQAASPSPRICRASGW